MTRAHLPLRVGYDNQVERVGVLRAAEYILEAGGSGGLFLILAPNKRDGRNLIGKPLRGCPHLDQPLFV
jgi:hypothetical protein